MDPENLEELLEAAFDEESSEITLSSDAPLPSKLIWIVADGSYVTKDQIIAILNPVEGNIYENSRDLSDYQLLNHDTTYENIQNMGDIAQKNLIVKSSISGRLIRIVDNLTELTNLDHILGRIKPTNCSHEVVVHGMCANCSVHVDTGLKRKHEDLNSHTETSAVPGFITSHAGVEIDSDLAYEMECSEISKYLQDRKLCLVLDLDNTLVHATSQGPPADIDVETIVISSVEWHNNLNYVQYVSEDDVEGMKLQNTLESSVLKTIVYNETETSYCNSYFKLRPGIFKFFRNVSKRYKLFLFTMGTRQHAQSALRILDPQGVYFGNRVFCRNDSKSCMKSLDRLFPNHKNLVLVMDDSEYVWTNKLALIKVHPYYFFSDLTYLNNYDLNNLTKSSAALQSICNYSNFVWSKLIRSSSDAKSNTPEKTASESGQPLRRDNDGFVVPAAINISQFRYNGYLICNERPSDIYVKPTVDPKGGENTHLFKKIRIKDNDKQLDKLITLLDDIYTRFYVHYDLAITDLLKSNNSEFVQAVNGSLKSSDVKFLIYNDLLPSASLILNDLREEILKDVTLYSNTPEFIHVNPHARNSSPSRSLREDTDINFLLFSDFGKWARKFGAKIGKQMDHMTHLVVNNRNCVTLHDENVKKVHIKWLEAVFYCHERVDEQKFNPDNWNTPFRSFWDVLSS
ncbi:protein-serine/threonine phosphatase [Theileria orientalis]|uniref:protein-serine/threonine phosphatase n=1 Tax=Theileria orientalis TaxID=68886 RepID=A0A976QWU4_THEOR|nr:protein-serine/threonine phosphatase [Theileria orientalis]